MAARAPSFLCTLFLCHVSVSATTIVLPISRSPSFQLRTRQPYMPTFMTSLITASPEAASFVVAGDHLRFEWGLDAFDVSCLLDRPLTIISRSLGISSANSMSLRHIITLRSTGSLLAEPTFTESLVLSAVAFRSAFDVATWDRDRSTTFLSTKHFQLKRNLDVEETFQMNIKHIDSFDRECCAFMRVITRIIAKRD